MSEVRRHVFPSLEGAVEAPSWMKAKPEARVSREEETQTLVDRLRNGKGKRQEQPLAAAPPPPPPVMNDVEPDGFDLPDEIEALSPSKLPPPPSLGSLVPGGRSNPPPANDVDEALEERSAAYTEAALELAIARASVLSSVEGQLLDLAIEVASAVIEREVEATPELHVVLARAALQSLGDATHVKLRTSNEGYVAITRTLGSDRTELRGVSVEIIPDPSIPGLGCVVDGEHVRVDATVTERLRAVRRAFEDERRRRVEGDE